jgi:hypothetical protein
MAIEGMGNECWLDGTRHAKEVLMQRRTFLRGSTTVLALTVIGCGSSAPNCEAPPGLTAAQTTQRTALHYRERAGDRTRNCVTCNFFTAAGENACGNCTLGLGSVNPNGVCDGFAARAS